MYWNIYRLSYSLYSSYGWIVTLDVLKFWSFIFYSEYNRGWIVTLDVLKYASSDGRLTPVPVE